MACNVETIKLIGKYINTPVGSVCYNTDKVLTTVLNKKSVEGFASIVLRLSSQSGMQLSEEQILLAYQWLEHIAIYANQAHANPSFAKSFLNGINKALQKNSYLTGQFLTVADVAAYYVLYSLLERLTITERESFLHLCRWMRHIQAQPRLVSPAHIPLPKQMYPHELKNASLDKPIVFYPQPFSFPGYPVVLYL